MRYIKQKKDPGIYIKAKKLGIGIRSSCLITPNIEGQSKLNSGDLWRKTSDVLSQEHPPKPKNKHAILVVMFGNEINLRGRFVL